MAKAKVSELVAAAQALDDELQRFEDAAAAAAKAPMNSQKHLEKAAKALSAIIEFDGRMQERVKALVDAVGKARERQQQKAVAVAQAAEVLQARTTLLQELMNEFARIGQGASELNTRMQAIAESKDVAEIDALHARMGEIADGAQALAERCAEQKFDDVGGQADSLRQQLLSARNKLALLKKALAGSR